MPDLWQGDFMEALRALPCALSLEERPGKPDKPAGSVANVISTSTQCNWSNFLLRALLFDHIAFQASDCLPFLSGRPGYSRSRPKCCPAPPPPAAAAAASTSCIYVYIYT